MSATSPRPSRACARRSRRRSGRSPATCACATSRAPTASTSSTSSCRSRAATSHRAGSRSPRSATCCATHLPPGDPLAGYAERLDDPALRATVRGYLTGSLDVVVRLPDGRYAVADYKTNWLGPPDAPLTAWHHRPSALAAEIRRAHYGLQALLYTAALHRYLRWRLPGYDPGRDLAGVLYLFLRGMTGPGTPRVGGEPCGVFAWRPPGALVEALSDVLDGAEEVAA